ncbi:MAG TPA: hypothetical protein VHO94_05600 [Oscillospiraceae bacterium]|nr:hypothetical protein [Oscillospiraceae bacterium]
MPFLEIAALLGGFFLFKELKTGIKREYCKMKFLSSCDTLFLRLNTDADPSATAT